MGVDQTGQQRNVTEIYDVVRVRRQVRAFTDGRDILVPNDATSSTGCSDTPSTTKAAL